jgi:dCMP deaminase
MKPKILVYLPVIHQGYLKLFAKYPDADIFIINQSLIELIDQEFDYLRKEIRSLTPEQAEKSLEALLPDRNISLLGANDLMLLNHEDQKIILPKEDIFIWLSQIFLIKSLIVFETTFLRWNKENSSAQQLIKTQTSIKTKKFTKIMRQIADDAKNQAQLSSDWWRQIGAIIFSETPNKIIAIAHNHHLPSPYTPYIDSDPRNSFHQNEKIELSTAIHAEAALIANCAKTGLPLEGKSMYVTTFPCPVCAKQIATSGITKLYFSDGYSTLDGEKVLKNLGVKIIKLS